MVLAGGTELFSQIWLWFIEIYLKKTSKLCTGRHSTEQKILIVDQGYYLNSLEIMNWPQKILSEPYTTIFIYKEMQ